MCRVLHLLREPGEEEVEVLRPSDDVAQVLEDRLQIGCRSAADRLHKRGHLVLRHRRQTLGAETRPRCHEFGPRLK